MNQPAVYLTNTDEAKIVMDTWAKIAKRNVWDNWKRNAELLNNLTPFIFILVTDEYGKKEGNDDYNYSSVWYRDKYQIGSNFESAKHYAKKENLNLMTFNEFKNKYIKPTSKNYVDIDWNIVEGDKMSKNEIIKEEEKKSKNLAKRLERMISKEKKKEKELEDDMEIAKNQIKKHKKALEALKKYDEE